MKILVYTPFRVGSSYICQSLKDQDLKKVTFFRDLEEEKKKTNHILIKDHTQQERTNVLKSEDLDLIITCIRKPTEVFISSFIKDFQDKGYPYYFDKEVFTIQELVDHFLSFEWHEFEWLSNEQNLKQIYEISGVDFNKENFDKNLGYNLIGKTLLLTHNFVFNEKDKYHELLQKIKPRQDSEYQNFVFSNRVDKKDIYKDFKDAIPRSFFDKYDKLDKNFQQKFGTVNRVDTRFYERPTDGILDATICKNELGSYCIPKPEIKRGAGRIINEKGKVYEACLLHFVRDNCNNKDVVQAGAFFGDMLPAISRWANHVWSFEPVRRYFRCAQITIQLNDLKNITLKNLALGKDNEEGQIRTRNKFGEPIGGGSRIQDIDNKEIGCETIQIARLDDQITNWSEREISIIQLDVEKFEPQALEGAFGIIDKWHPILILEAIESEYKPEIVTESDWYRDNIFSRGYEVADFQGVMGDSGYVGRIHGNIVLCHPNRPWKKYFNQENK